MTDEEIICTFMESLAGDIHYLEFRPKLDLDALHEVEARLTDEQWEPYVIALLPVKEPAPSYEYHFLHASAEQKIKALAVVLRNENKP